MHSFQRALPMKLSTVSDWFSYINGQHQTEIDLGLERIKVVAERLGVLTPTCPLIMVAGTNGKGTTVTTLESIYHAHQYQTATFTSPYLFKPNEQVRINEEWATDQMLCEVFLKVENARLEISLTSFEYFTLAALLIFKSHKLDVMILEIGLGGRLDAVNILDADVAIITSIAIDHVAYLGPTREHIAFEKAGIFKSHSLAICGDANPPDAVIKKAEHLSIPLYIQGQSFKFQQSHDEWSWWSEQKQYEHLPLNDLNIENMSTVMMAVTLLQNKLPVNEEDIKKGLASVKLPGRVQIIAGEITTILDVAHNPHAVNYLKKRLLPFKTKTNNVHAVFSMLGDKDILQCVELISDAIDTWYVAPLTVKRAASLEQLKSVFAELNIESVNYDDSIKEAYENAKEVAESGDVIVVFGSFHTVAHTLNPRAHQSTL